MYLLALPDDVLEKILSYVSYDEVSRDRLVCQRFNDIGKRVLNHGFHKVEKYHSKCLKFVKAQLPRRESERRNHPLARHSDILTAIETRLSLLSMTFKKFIDMNICCFIPGKVLDEIYRVLRYVTSVQAPIRTHEVLQELRDLSSMAMEYFDEKIAPGLKRHKETGPRINILCTSSKHFRPNTPTPSVYKMARFVNELAKRHNNLMSEVSALRVKKKELESIGKRVADLEKLASESKKKISESEKLIDEQKVTIAQQTAQLYEQDLKLEKLSKIVEDKQVARSSASTLTNFKTGKIKRKYFPQTKKTAASQRLKRKIMHNQKDETNKGGRKKLKT